ncbi:hypothetical protein COCON_G00174450 [Conger conger]|uniref:Nucleolar protein 8 n=1 Tax=Conger conger TaxID=82655 RepID=A0A9Q1HSC3_CONCO|nr:hypothetical protein COCON_G00174450 [Conger conger]
MKRLYIGGLGHAISQKDLKDRFGKFGEVSDVEIITRKDETGLPVKTFGYININISDEALRKCMTVLNKSKWKGGTLQIEIAKENFLQRLAVERQQATEKTQFTNIEQKEKLVESFKKAGVENFHMKAAVPGTEIPGHKDWVYDPSKHSHNIKRLENEADAPTLTPVSQLTWEILDGDDDISKKRRGEFPPLKARPKKIRKESPCEVTENSRSVAKHNGHGTELRGASAGDEANSRRVSRSGANTLLKQKVTSLNGPAQEKENPVQKRQTKFLYVFDNEADSDEEIRTLVARENARTKDAGVAEDEDALEVVGDDFAVKPSLGSWAGQNSKGGLAAGGCGEPGDEREYDSADTDEILTQSKAPAAPVKQKEAEAGRTPPSPPRAALNKSDAKPGARKRKQKQGSEVLSKQPADLEQLAKEAAMAEEEESGGCQESDSQAGSGQGGASTAPLTKKGTTPEEILAAILEEDSSDEESAKGKGKKKKRQNKSQPPSLPAFLGTRALLETAPAAPPGLRPKRSGDDEERGATEAEKKPKSERALPSSDSGESNSGASSSDGEEEEDPKRRPSAGDTDGSAPKREVSLNGSEASRAVPATERAGATDEASTKDSTSATAKRLEGKTLASAEGRKPSQKPVCAEDVRQKQKQDNLKRLAALEQKQKEAEQQKKLIQGALSTLDAPAASKGKHIVFDSEDEGEEAAEQSSVEQHKPTKSLFEESESSTEEPGELGPATGAKQGLRVKDFEKEMGSKLFDSEDDDDDDEEADDEDDGDEARFQIKPQFEGKSGQKLMRLQARFGTDERFRMDSRFLDSDDESNIPEETSSRADVEVQLEEEKQKNLDILQSLLNINVQRAATSKEATKSKQFRDISALHYDPTREEHAAFEKKSEEPKKDSKAARRKKREEAEKLPEVSKDIYYDVAVDLKEAFGSQKEKIEMKPAVAWDKEEEAEQEEGDEEEQEEEEEEEVEKDAPEEKASVELSLSSANASATNAESTGFQFSFFGNNATEDTTVKDDYKIEILKGAKQPWQENPCFRDSSEDEDEDKMEEGAGDQSASVNATEEPVVAKKRFFFFFQDDERLKEGPKMFCRSAKLEDQREHWEVKRTTLIEEYRKKHKDARRRIKASQKS